MERGMYKFAKKLGKVKRHLREWNRDCFGNIFTRLKETEAAYHLREVEYNSTRDKESKIRLHEARAKYNKKLAIECGYWKQKVVSKKGMPTRNTSTR